MSDGVRNLADALRQVPEHWQPHRLTSFDDYDFKIVKLQGEFVWHTHEVDELFLVISGELTIRQRGNDRDSHNDSDNGLADVVLGPQDVYVVPRGVEHCPVAVDEVCAVLIEPKGTLNTGDVGGALTNPLRELS
jgi:mannose-6-phosphate isomerase-like protein (cupin superfamily)